jgi:hypothetical protein
MQDNSIAAPAKAAAPKTSGGAVADRRGSSAAAAAAAAPRSSRTSKRSRRDSDPRQLSLERLPIFGSRVVGAAAGLGR